MRMSVARKGGRRLDHNTTNYQTVCDVMDRMETRSAVILFAVAVKVFL